MSAIIEMAKQAVNDGKQGRATSLALISIAESLDLDGPTDRLALSLEPLEPDSPDLREAAQCLVDVLGDDVLNWGRPAIGYVNTETIKHWRDKLYACLVAF